MQPRLQKKFVEFGDHLWRVFYMVLTNVDLKNHLTTSSTSRLTVNADLPGPSLECCLFGFFIFLLICKVFLSANVFLKKAIFQVHG